MEELKIITRDIYGYIQNWKEKYTKRYIIIKHPFPSISWEYKSTSLVKLVSDCKFKRVGNPNNKINRIYQYDKVYLITEEEKDIYLLTK
jgi:hypothetical protein